MILLLLLLAAVVAVVIIFVVLAKFFIGVMIFGIIIVYGGTCAVLMNFFGEQNQGLAVLATLPVGSGIMGLLMAFQNKSKTARNKLLIASGGCFLLGIIISLFTKPNAWNEFFSAFSF
jgi:hypothetical protein